MNMASSTIKKNNEPLLLATATANQTYADQLASLKATYDTLTNAQKKKTFIAETSDYNDIRYSNTHVGIGCFSANICNGSGDILMFSMRMISSIATKIIAKTNGTSEYTNLASTTNSNALTLWLDN